ncbi:MAG TPA: peptidylprolyl isomerase [Chitinophagaceae bacterium]|nr:peptidylprolyl isomerase [Chitinophagaceae bacterium]
MLYTQKPAAFFFLFFGLVTLAQAQPKKAVADKIVAIVGDRIILKSDITNSILDMQRQGTNLPDSAECLLTQQALISKVLMLQAEKDSLPVTEEEVEAELDQRIRYFINQVGTQDALEEMAGKTVYQIKDDARESVKERKLAEAMQRKIVENVRITPVEAKAWFDRIPKDSLPFYESELEIGQIVLYPKASRDIEQYIISEMNSYRKQIETKVTTFSQLAMKISEDPGSKERGGLYEINRNEKTWDPVFMSTAFRLKEGEISAPVKSKFGYHLITLEQRNGDVAIVRHILRVPPVTDDEIKKAIAKLDSVRARIIAGTISFNEAASKYSEDETAKFLGPLITNREGSTYVRIDQLDKEMVATISKMQVGDYSQPVPFTSEEGKKGVRVIYLKSRSEPHRMNMRDDYSRISQYALEEKKSKALDKWLRSMIPTYYVMVDNISAGECPILKKYNTTDEKGF